MTELEISCHLWDISRLLSKRWATNMNVHLHLNAEPHWKVLNIHQADPLSSLNSAAVTLLWRVAQ